MEFYKSDDIEIEVTANEDITGWKIRAELYDISGSSVKIATANVTGGSATQISIDDATTGIFTLNFVKDETTSFEDKAWLEIERVDSNDKKKTIYKGNVTMLDEQIDWDSVS